MRCTETQPLSTSEQLYQDRAHIAMSPGLANGGIALAVIEPDLIGWDQIEELLCTYGFIAFGAAHKVQFTKSLKLQYGDDIELPFWDTFIGDQSDAYPVCASCLAHPQTPQWRLFSTQTPTARIIETVRTLNERVGVAPLPDWYMRGEGPPSLTSWIEDEAGEMVACANGSMRYHEESRLAGVYYVGSVSVGSGNRGKGLGTLVTALSIRDGIDEFRCKKIMGIAQPSNAPSRAMLERCGLLVDPERATIILNKSGAFQTR
mgnify:CR=1 FL=1